MASVTLDLIQSGSGSTTLHVENGDTLTFLLQDTIGNQEDALENAFAGLGGLADVTGVTFVASLAGNGSYPLTVTQTGSASAAIDGASGDTITLELAAVVENDVLAQANAALAALYPITGVKFAINTSGGAS